MTYRTKGRPESTNIEDNRPDDQFFEALTPHFKPSADQVQSAQGTSKAAQDDATSILNDMFTGQRSAERAWVSKQNYHALEDMGFYNRAYSPAREKQVRTQVNNQSQFLLDTFKRARTAGYPIGPLLPMLHGYPSSTFGDAQSEPYDPNQENN